MSSDEEEIEVIHVKQRYSWDCGLACARMILKTYDRDLDKFQDVCDKLDLNDSIWTVDIAAILTNYKISYLYVTKRAGIDQKYRNDPFYKDTFLEDSERIDYLFRNARNLRLNIQLRSVGITEIINHLEGGQPIIILLDWSRIKSKKFVFNCMDPSESLSYQGHFVVLVSYDDDKECFYYLDPERNKRKKKLKEDDLERARKSFGTDEDVIFIYDD